jgi:hypothetical protein
LRIERRFCPIVSIASYQDIRTQPGSLIILGLGRFCG